MTTKLAITADKNSLHIFSKKIKSFLDKELETSSTKSTWKDTWLQWKDDGFGSNRKLSRYQLARLVLGTTVKDKSVTNIINVIRTTFSPIDDSFVFTPTANDKDLWYMTEKGTTENKKNENETSKTDDSIAEWTTVPGTNTRTGACKSNVTPNTKADKDKSFTNSYDPLAITTAEDPDADISYSTSYDDSTNPKISDNSTTKSDETEIDVEADIKNKPSKAPESNQISIEDEDAIIKMVNDKVLNGNADDIESIQHLAIWINSKTQSATNIIDSNKTILDQHVKSIQLNLNESVKTITESTKKAELECTQLNTATTNNTKTSRGIVEQNEKQMRNIHKDLQKSETSAIAAVNITANRRKAEIDTKLGELETLLHTFDNNKTIPVDCLNEVNNTVKLLREEIKSTYEDFEEMTSTMIDDQKQDFREWMERVLGTGDMKVITDLISETEKLKASQLLMDNKRHEIDAWFKTTKDAYTDMTTTQTTPLIHPHQPPYAPDTAVKYTKDLYKIYGYIMNTCPPIFENGKWYFEIFSMNGTTLNHCCEDHIEKLEDKIPTTIPDPIPSTTIPQITKTHAPAPAPAPAPSHFDTPITSTPIKQEPIEYNHHHKPWQNNNTTNRRLAENEFEYPIGSIATTVNGQQLLKHAEKWKFALSSALDLRGFYDQLQILLRNYKIYLRDYNDINAMDGLQAITEDTCKNYSSACSQMSQALIMYFQTFGEEIFIDYKEPLDYIAAFRATSDGLGFLKRVMKKRHPHLKDIINRKTPKAPEFNHYQSIHLFIQAYIEWIHDENLRGGRTYDHKEKLDHILNNLDSRFKIATTKIEEKLDTIYADPHDPKDFPTYLQLTSKLGMYITDLIPDEKKEDLTNNVPKIHAVTRYQQRQQQPYNNKHKKGSYEKGAPSMPPPSTSDPMQLNWKVIPGAVCPACKKNNHNVYQTGCPSLGLFSACKEFYDKTPQSTLQPILNAYKQYQRELGKRLKERRNNDRRTLRTVAHAYGEDDVATLKKALFDSYKQDHLDEQYITDNPYEDYYFDESPEDDSE